MPLFTTLCFKPALRLQRQQIPMCPIHQDVQFSSHSRLQQLSHNHTNARANLFLDQVETQTALPLFFHHP